MTVVVGLAITFLLSGATLAETRVALVIGNSNYQSLGTLTNPANDAADMSSALTGMGFDVMSGFDMTERQFEVILSDFATKADGADIALFYYSGHGLQFQSENYLVPVDADLDTRFSLTHQTMPLADIVAATERARTTLMFIDACRTFPIDGTFLAQANERVTAVRGLAPMPKVQNTFIGLSASAGKTASDGTGRNSPFTSAMLEYLPKPGISVTDAFNNVTERVVQTTNGGQKPESMNGVAEAVVLVAAPSTPVVAAGPDAEERAYRDAAEIGTIGAWRAYLARYPGGFYSELAKEALGKLTRDASAPPTVEAAPVIEPSLSVSPAPTDGAEIERARIAAYEKSIADGDLDAAFNLGLLLAKPEFVPADPQRAVRLIVAGLPAGKNRYVQIIMTSSLPPAARLAMQLELQRLGFYGGAIDGDFGRRTETALRRAAGIAVPEPQTNPPTAPSSDAPAVAAPSFLGTWAFAMDCPIFDFTNTFVFTAANSSTVRGTNSNQLGSGQIAGGSVSGSDIRFTIAYTRNGKAFKESWNAHMTSADTLRGSMTGQESNTTSCSFTGSRL